MSMKKKFLALALAGAVAMPLTANATGLSASGYQPVEGALSDKPTSDLIINGSVSTRDNAAPAGRIQVELPTAMSFTVDASGTFKAPTNFEIRNTGKENVQVEVLDFIESRPSTGVTVVAESALNNPANEPRSKVALTLTGSTKVDLGQVLSSHTPAVLCNKIDAGATQTITVGGIAGTSNSDANAENNGVNENFTVKFRISHKA